MQSQRRDSPLHDLREGYSRELVSQALANTGNNTSCTWLIYAKAAEVKVIFEISLERVHITNRAVRFLHAYNVVRTHKPSHTLIRTSLHVMTTPHRSKYGVRIPRDNRELLIG